MYSTITMAGVLEEDGSVSEASKSQMLYQREYMLKESLAVCLTCHKGINAQHMLSIMCLKGCQMTHIMTLCDKMNDIFLSMWVCVKMFYLISQNGWYRAYSAKSVHHTVTACAVVGIIYSWFLVFRPTSFWITFAAMGLWHSSAGLDESVKVFELSVYTSLYLTSSWKVSKLSYLFWGVLWSYLLWFDLLYFDLLYISSLNFFPLHLALFFLEFN